MSLIRYLLEFSICLALFYGLYHFLLRKETFFQLNRWYLLLSPALSMLIPFINFEWPADPEPGNWDQVIIPLVTDIQHQQHLLWENLQSTSTKVWSMTYLDLLVLLYLLGTVFMGYRLLGRTWMLMRLIGEGKQERKGAYTMVRTQKRLPAASFMSYVFWEDGPLDPERKKILEHELVHVRQWHSLDVLLMEIWVMFKWFHPLIYWYRNSLRLTHEYIADAYVSDHTGSRFEYARLLVQTQPTKLSNRLVHQFNSSKKMRLLMLSKHQSEKWKYLKYLFIGPVTAVLFLLFSLNHSTPVVQTIDRAEAVLNQVVNQPIVVDPVPVQDGNKNYQLKWGTLECDCYTDQYPGLYYCEDKSLSPEGLRTLIRKNGGFQLTRDGAPQHILELTAVSKNTKDLGGYKGQFDEMGTDFRTASPLWEQAEIGDVFRFTFKNALDDHFQFEVIVSDARKNYSFGEKVVIGGQVYDLINFKTHFESSKWGGLLELDFEAYRSLTREPLRLQKDERSYYTISNINLINFNAMRAEVLRDIDHTGVDLSQMKTVLEAQPGDEIRIRMNSQKSESVDFVIRIKKTPAFNLKRKKVQVQWGDMILEKNQSVILSKEEIYQLLKGDMYLLYGEKFKVKREANMNSFYFTTDNKINPIRYQESFRKIVQQVKPGEQFIMGGMITEGEYVLPGFRIFVDFNWREIFAGHSHASFSDGGSTVTINNAEPADLLRVLALEDFSPVPYVVEVDGVAYTTDDKKESSLKELLDNQLPRKSLKISRRDFKTTVDLIRRW